MGTYWVEQVDDQGRTVKLRQYGTLKRAQAKAALLKIKNPRNTYLVKYRGKRS